MTLFLHYLFLFFLKICNAYKQDLNCLLSFKASADPLNASLQTWVGHDPCSGSWLGIRCHGGRVVSISLDGVQLVGNAAPLLALNHLQQLSLKRNALTGSLPRLTNLKNARLKHLFLSRNQLYGSLNIALPALLSLRLEHNDFSGGLDALEVPFVNDFNVSENRLHGEISSSLSKFPVASFSGNQALCGSPLPSCSNPSTTPTATAKLGMNTVLTVGVGDIIVISVVLALIMGMYIWLKKKLAGISRSTDNIEDLELNSDDKRKNTGLVCFQGGEALRLDCLLKASAEVLGKSVAGSTYKAVLDHGLVVAVKRLNITRFSSSSKAFDRRMQLMGRVRHCNVVSLRAYYNVSEEKLLVYDYMPNGGLHSLLHSNCLDWRRRKQILMGAAQGLSFIHGFPARLPLVHGNIKPSNILIDEQGNACVSELGLMCSGSNVHQCFPSHSSRLFSAAMNRQGYRAPELASGKAKATQASDVYCFGMVLLEVVTDKEVDEEECEGELMGMVKIGMMCTMESPEERPKMTDVVSMLSDFVAD